MKTHATIGGKLLEGDDSDLMRMAHEIALTHHEKWDGNGYPNGLAGESIPQSGRITALTDVFDALTSSRSYKKAWTLESAVSFIQENSGKHFDPRLVDAFMRVLPDIIKIREHFADTSQPETWEN
jgi:putative two-component system response regulator